MVVVRDLILSKSSLFFGDGIAIVIRDRLKRSSGGP